MWWPKNYYCFSLRAANESATEEEEGGADETSVLEQSGAQEGGALSDASPDTLATHKPKKRANKRKAEESATKTPPGDNFRKQMQWG